ncbi:M3 family metallopeptidase [Pseudomonas capeferrum]|nr:M3 family metallopeptidase [Pseudomonas capeferrum]
MPEHVLPAIEQVIAEHEAGLQRIIEAQEALPTWDDLVLAVDALDARLQGVFYSIVPLMFRDEAWQTQVHACFGLVDVRFKQKLKNARLHALYRRLADSELGVNLDAHRRSTLAQALEEFRQAGALLDDADQDRLVQLEAQIRELEGLFAANIGRSVEHSAIHLTDGQRLGEVPQRLRDEMAQKAKAASLTGWLIACEEAACKAILEHASDRDLRQQVYKAYHTRGWDAEAGHDNEPVLERLAKARHEKARLLGFANHMELSLRTKSAGSVERVHEFLDDLARRVSPMMQRWQAGLRRTASDMGLTDVQPWDLDYLQAMGRRATQALSVERFREFYPLGRVVEALRDLARQLFGLTLNPYEAVGAWDPSVSTFEVVQDHAVIGYLYLDLVERPGKQSGSVFTSYVWNRRIDAEGIYHGAVAIVFSDTSAGLEGAPPLLDPLALRKLFHEFGHALHHLLVRTSNHVLSDVRRFGTDGVEVSGKLLERWACNAAYLASISSHVENGGVLTEAQVQSVLASQETGVRECAENLSRALFDLDLHQAPDDGRTIHERAEASYAKVSRWPMAGFEKPMHAFDYLISGYDAGYYAYLWSDVRAFDLFSRFEREGLLDAAAGRALQEDFFAHGTARSLAESIETFLGRPVSATSYLRGLGLNDTGGE